MNSFKSIGGYFELETNPLGGDYHENAIRLNSARNGFEYILRTKKPRRVYMPKFMCDVMLEPLEKLGIPYVFYKLDMQFEIDDIPSVTDEEILVYVNYFGIKNAYCSRLSGRLGARLIVDASQAFFYQRSGTEHVIYSPRKFFGVSDGGYVLTDQEIKDKFDTDVSFERMGHLLKRVDLGAEEAYEDFKSNDDSLIGQPIKEMSRLTRKILHSVNYDRVKKRRQDNFQLLDTALGSNNDINIQTDSSAVAMIYPFRVSNGAADVRKTLIAQKIFVPTYWPNVLAWCSEDEIEYHLANDIIALPIDQRYTKQDMEKVLKVLL